MKIGSVENKPIAPAGTGNASAATSGKAAAGGTLPGLRELNGLFRGPQVIFEALFPRPGTYRIWSQFLRSNVMTTVTFTVKVERLQ